MYDGVDLKGSRSVLGLNVREPLLHDGPCLHRLHEGHVLLDHVRHARDLARGGLGEDDAVDGVEALAWRWN